MAQDTTPAMVIYTGVYDSETQTYQTSFQAPFDKGAYGEIKVAFVRRGLTDYTYDPDTYTTEVIDDRVWIHWTGDDITTNDIICIVRETQDGQPYTYPNNQKHIERALDNLSRQIQEVAKKAQNALLVDPSWMPVAEGGSNDPDKMDPVAWLQTIVRSKGKTLRELRVEDGYAMYTSDDPESSEKTWEVLAGVKTDNAGVISHIREHEVTLQDGTTERYLQYSVDGGATWEDCANTSAVSFGEVHGSPYDNTALALALNDKVSKSGDNITGELTFNNLAGIQGCDGTDTGRGLELSYKQGSYFYPNIYITNKGISPVSQNHNRNLGERSYAWNTVFALYLNNGYNDAHNIAIPETTQDDTLALKSQVDLAANSGRMITDEGVWYAKMDAAGTIPSSAEVEGRNYADFTQVDGDNNPIIVIYTYTSGAWVQTETITPPASYDGYVPVTSKIWDIPEQTGQQGGRILWNYQSKDFTPYPLIISFDNANITNSAFQGSADLSGTSTVTMPANPGTTQIVNKNYVDNAVLSGGFQPDLFDIKWRDATTDNTAWALSDGNWKTSANGYNHLLIDVTKVSYIQYNANVYSRSAGDDQPSAPEPYAWDYDGWLMYTTTENPAVGDLVYYSSTMTTSSETITVANRVFNSSLQQTETVAGTTITYYQAADGHKVIKPDQETNANAIYTATGVAWYYVLDTVNSQFKLPRTNFAFVGSRGNVGNYVEAGLPNITGANAIGYSNAGDPTGAFVKGANLSTVGSGAGQFWAVNLDASQSNSIYGNDTTVQQPATQMYLYFYVGIAQ